MPNTTNTAGLWTGRILSIAVVLFLLADGLTGVLYPERLAGAIAETGFPPALVGPIGWIAIVSAVIYALPRTKVLGAILVTGFLGGAICSHFRLGDIGSPPQIVCLIVGVAAWVGLFLRSPALRLAIVES